MNDAQRAMQLFEEALALDGDARKTFLDRTCANDKSLRVEIEALLRADAASGEFLAAPITAASGDRGGERLGPYRLLRLIGSGGMGSVYLAQRADGAFTKSVAIKLLLYDAGDLRTRFALEQRILGALSHPNIASLLDVGSDANGAPYLVMEYVEGKPINAWAHEQELDLPARVRCFIKILDAVQTAHAQLVVHRDIKPSNVLVDVHAEPKLLDFGIAKLIGDPAPGATRTGLGPLTPEYASPEQVRGELLGTGSDIYSLGVLLFELVTGERPYRIGDMRPSAIERIVCDTDPPRPSTRMAMRSVDGSMRDLDAVILKAMSKQAERRYASCAMFAEDLRRWLRGEHVLAREPSWSERSGRVLRRHRLAVSAAAAVVLALLLGAGIALWQAHVAREQAQLARNERDRAQRINRFLTDTLAAANPADLGRKATVVEVLDRARRLADKELTSDPEAAASAQLTLAQSFRSLGDLDSAQASGEAALSAAQRRGDYSMIIEAESTLGNVYIDKGNSKLARKMYEQAHHDAQAHGSVLQRGTAALDLGLVENEEGNAVQAQSWLQIALSEFPESAVVERASAMDSLGFAKDLLGDRKAAIDLRRQALVIVQAAFPQGHPTLITISGNLATALLRNGDFDEAVTILDRVLPMQMETLGEYHSDIVWTLTTLASIERKRNHLDAALAYALRAYTTAQHLSDDNDWKAYAFEKYGDLLTHTNRAAEALPILQKAMAIDKAMLPADHQSIATAQSALGLAEAMTGDRKTGEPLARDGYQRLLAKYGEKNDFTIAAKARLDAIAALPQH